MKYVNRRARSVPGYSLHGLYFGSFFDTARDTAQSYVVVIMVLGIVSQACKYAINT